MTLCGLNIKYLSIYLFFFQINFSMPYCMNIYYMLLRQNNPTSRSGLFNIVNLTVMFGCNYLKPKALISS